MSGWVGWLDLDSPSLADRIMPVRAMSEQEDRQVDVGTGETVFWKTFSASPVSVAMSWS